MFMLSLFTLKIAGTLTIGPMCLSFDPNMENELVRRYGRHYYALKLLSRDALESTIVDANQAESETLSMSKRKLSRRYTSLSPLGSSAEGWRSGEGHVDSSMHVPKDLPFLKIARKHDPGSAVFLGMNAHM
jgi:hypothetical protein